MPLEATSVPARSGQPSQFLLVLLHGWGANAEDVATLATLLDVPDYQMIFPNAPFPYLYAPQGRVWYNFPPNYRFESSETFAQQADVLESRRLLTEWLRSLPSQSGVPLSRTILGGFSQGGAMTLDVGLSLPLAGLLVLSGFLHSPPKKTNAFTAPIRMIHGTLDQVVPLQSAQQARDYLLQQGVDLDYEEFVMGHEISLPVIQAVEKFTQQIRTLPDATA